MTIRGFKTSMKKRGFEVFLDGPLGPTYRDIKTGISYGGGLLSLVPPEISWAEIRAEVEKRRDGGEASP